MRHARVLDVQTPPRGKSWVGIGDTLAELRSAHTSLGQLDSSGARNFGRKRSYATASPTPSPASLGTRRFQRWVAPTPGHYLATFTRVTECVGPHRSRQTP